MIDWDELRDQANAYLNDHYEIAHDFREAVEPIFTSQLEKAKRPFTRRPNISLRLIAADMPLAKLVILPAFSYGSGTIDPLNLRLELMVEQDVTFDGEPAKKWSQQVTAMFNDHLKAGAIRQTALEDLERVVTVMRDFLDDSPSVFARSHSHCCCCGRGLSDELSRARGIGPECIKVIDKLYFMTDKQTLVCQEA